MKKVAVLVEDQYQVLEVWYPYLRLQEAGFKPVFVGTGIKKKYESKEGYLTEEEISIKQAKVSDFDSVVIPGGYAPDILRRYPEMNIFVEKMYEKGKLVTAICHAGWVLVSAGILKDKKATCFFSPSKTMLLMQARNMLIKK